MIIVKFSELKALLSSLSITLIAMSGLDIYTPSLPVIKDYFSSSNNIIQMTISCYYFGMEVSVFLWSYLR